jgi:hypothetical protein
MTVSTGKKLLENSNLLLPVTLSANEFAPTEKSDFTQTGYTQINPIKYRINLTTELYY